MINTGHVTEGGVVRFWWQYMGEHPCSILTTR